MGYDAGKLHLVSQGIAGSQRWEYYDTGGETIAGYSAEGFFSDAKDYGVDTGDFVTINNRGTGDYLTGFMYKLQDTGATQGSWKRDTGNAAS